MNTNQMLKERANESKKTNGKPDKEENWVYPFENKIFPHQGGVGFAKAAYTRLLFEKLNFTEEEVEKISNSSADFCERSAKRFEEETRKIKFREDYLMIINRHYPTPVLTTREGGGPGDLPSPVDICIPSSQNFKYIHEYAKGWGTLEGFVEQPVKVEFEFKYTPPVTGYYKFYTELWVFGSYYVIADDGSCDSKEAKVRMYADMNIRQIVPKVQGRLYSADDILYLVDERAGTTLFFQDGGQNINKFEPIFDRKSFGTDNGIFLYKDVSATITVNANLVTYARGSGSHADISCLQGHGGISCDKLCIKSV